MALLWPGRITIVKKKPEIHKGRNWNGIESFEIINPLPVPLDEGILDVDAYIKKGDEIVYSKFLQDYSPDVIHMDNIQKNFGSTAGRIVKAWPGVRYCWH